MKLRTIALAALAILSGAADIQALPLARTPGSSLSQNVKLARFDTPRVGTPFLSTALSTSTSKMAPSRSSCVLSTSTGSRNRQHHSSASSTVSVSTSAPVFHAASASHASSVSHAASAWASSSPAPKETYNGTLSLFAPLQPAGMGIDLGGLAVSQRVSRGQPRSEFVLGFGLGEPRVSSPSVTLAPLNKPEGISDLASPRKSKCAKAQGTHVSRTSRTRTTATSGIDSPTLHVQIMLDVFDPMRLASTTLCAAYKPLSWPLGPWFSPVASDLYNFTMRPCTNTTHTNGSDARGYSQTFVYSPKTHYVYPANHGNSISATSRSSLSSRPFATSSSSSSPGSPVSFHEDAVDAIMVFTPLLSASLPSALTSTPSIASNSRTRPTSTSVTPSSSVPLPYHPVLTGPPVAWSESTAVGVRLG